MMKALKFDDDGPNIQGKDFKNNVPSFFVSDVMVVSDESISYFTLDKEGAVTKNG